MKKSFFLFRNELEIIDKFLIVSTFFVPIFLAISIFLADLFASISGIILIFIFFKKKNLYLFKKIKKEIIIFVVFYIIILISFLLTNYKSYSFLPSFFYFRYFLLSLSIFYLLKKYNFLNNTLYLIIAFSVGLVIFDAFFQLLFGFNLLGYDYIGYKDGSTMNYLTGFFEDEKKLGSYLVRFLPLIISLIYLIKPKISLKLELFIILCFGVIIYCSSERAAMFLLLLSYFAYFIFSKKKLHFVILNILIFVILLNTNESLKDKYLYFTLKQIGFNNLFNYDPKKDDKFPIKYYSEEHENLSYTALIIIQKNYLFGTGIKSFYKECEFLKKSNQNYTTKRHKLVCSTHPHNTYLQIFSEIGILGFIIVSYFFIYLISNCIKVIFKKDKKELDQSFFFINLSLILSLMPLIPSGSFFNNWISLMIYFPLGLWLFLKDRNFNEKNEKN